MAKVKSTSLTAIEDTHDRNLMPSFTFEYTGYAADAETPPARASRLTANVRFTVTKPDGSTQTVSKIVNISDSGIAAGQWVAMSNFLDTFLAAALTAEGYAEQ